MIWIKSGSFTGKGFTKGSVQATLEGFPYQGQWQGLFFEKEFERKIYLKGTISGDISGIVEGYLTESTPASGTYDQYTATWTINRLGTSQVSATLTVSGSVSYQGETAYPSTQLYALQTSIQGETFGHYSGPLDFVLTHVRVADETNPYNGQGFSIISYSSDSRTGEGWTYDKEIRQDIIEMNGLFTKPLLGRVTATLDETRTPRTLTVMMEQLDVGLPPAPDLNIKVWGPSRVSPGQTFDYLVVVSNDGLQSSAPFTLIGELPWEVNYVSHTGNGIYRNESREMEWTFEKIDAKKQIIVSNRVKCDFGLPQSHPFGYIAYIPKETPPLVFDPAITIRYEVIDTAENFTHLQYTISNLTDSVTFDMNNSLLIVPNYQIPIMTVDSDNEKMYYYYDFTFEGHSWDRVITWVMKKFSTAKDALSLIKQIGGYSGKTAKFVDEIKKIQYLYNSGEIDQATYEHLERVYQAKYVGQTVVNDMIGSAPYSNTGFPYGTMYSGLMKQADFGGTLQKLADRNAMISIEINKAFRSRESQAVGSQKNTIAAACDPNMKYGPEGNVLPGQKLDYRVEFENEGEGIAFGVYFTDTLDSDLDDSTLIIGPVKSTVDGSVIAPSGTYNSATQTITWLVGEVGSRKGGYADISINVRNDAPEGTEIINYGTVFFPSVPEITRTNGIVSIVSLNQPPVLDPVGSKSVDEGHQLQFVVSASDPNGDAMTYSTNILPTGALFDTVTNTFAWTPGFDQAGTYTVKFTVSDGTFTDTEDVTITVNDVDNIPPTTLIDVSGTSGNNGWYLSDVTITLSATDNEGGSGVATTEYSLDNGQHWNAYSQIVTITNEGTSSVSYHSIDTAGNIEEAKQVTISIDKTAPTTSPSYSGSVGNNGWYRSMVTVALTADDGSAGSGVEMTSYRIGSGTTNPYATTFTLADEGLTVIGYYSVDYAGNSEPEVTATVMIDTQLPVVSITSPVERAYLQSETVTVGWTATDAMSGIATLTATLDGTPVSNGQGIDLTGLSLGEHKLKVTADDHAGNTATAERPFTVRPLPAAVNVDPDTLNIKSQSDKNAMTVYIEIPGADMNGIDVSSMSMVSAKGSVNAQLSPTSVGDANGNGIPDRMVKFDRQGVIGIVEPGDAIKLTVTGKVAGDTFEGSDTIRVIDPGNKK